MSQNSNPMHRAIELSLQKMREGHGGPFGAVIVRDGVIIAEGWNQVLRTNDPTAHAEVTAIRNACQKLRRFDLSDCEIYTSCEPCPMCLAAIYWSRMGKVYFAASRDDAARAGFDDAVIYDEIAKQVDKRKISFEQLMKSEALDAFNEWIENPNKTMY